MDTQRLLSLSRRAADDYKMIREGDRIAVGLSGGKDSVSLLIALREMQRFYPHKYDITAVTVSLGFKGFDTEPLKKLCEKYDVQYHIVKTDIAEIVFDARMEKNPCSLCSKIRNGALHNEALRLGCNKVALGHNKNDAVQTLFLSMFYEGRINTFAPVTLLDRKNIYLIRPLIYIPERDLISFVKKNNIETVKNPCPANGNTKREEIKKFISEQSRTIRDFEEKIFGSFARLPVCGWEKPGGTGV